MENILDRFLRYVAIDTQSDDSSESQPSTAKQLNLLSLLCKELQEMGVEASLDEYGYVMGRIPSNLEGVSSADPLGCIPSASPDCRIHSPCGHSSRCLRGKRQTPDNQ